MMRSVHLEILAAQAATVGARVNRTGDGGFVILHRGQRHLVVSLRAVEIVLQQLEGGVGVPSHPSRAHFQPSRNVGVA